MTSRATLAIIGGGCAGLALARELAAGQFRHRFILVEPREEYSDDRSWCFWEGQDHRLQHLVSHRWQRWECSTADGQVVQQYSMERSYQYIRSMDYYKDALNSLDESSYCDQVNARLICIQRLPSGRFHLRTTSGEFEVDQVVDTRPPVFQQFSGALLFQCFSGCEIKLPSGISAQPNVVTLMGGLRTTGTDLMFDYILPLGPDRVLVETTRFSPRPVQQTRLEADLETLIQARGWQAGIRVREEHGMLPMGLPAAQSLKLPGLARAGIGAGSLRPASGYSFLRIQSWARHCADSLLRDGPVVSHKQDPRWRIWLDSVLLNVLKNRPDLGPEVLFRLFSRPKPLQLVNFLSDQAGPGDVLAIMQSLPVLPFAQEAIRTIGRRHSASA